MFPVSSEQGFFDDVNTQNSTFVRKTMMSILIFHLLNHHSSLSEQNPSR